MFKWQSEHEEEKKKEVGGKKEGRGKKGGGEKRRKKREGKKRCFTGNRTQDHSCSRSKLKARHELRVASLAPPINILYKSLPVPLI